MYSSVSAVIIQKIQLIKVKNKKNVKLSQFWAPWPFQTISALTVVIDYRLHENHEKCFITKVLLFSAI